MVEFNPDGSIKLLQRLEKKKEERENKMKSQRCILIAKEILSTWSPKKCALKITLSEAFKDYKFLEYTYNNFIEKSEVPTKFTKINDKEFKIEVGTSFRRCSDCTYFINQLKIFLDGNVILEKSGCDYERKANRNFSDLDYFD